MSRSAPAPGGREGPVKARRCKRRRKQEYSDVADSGHDCTRRTRSTRSPWNIKRDSAATQPSPDGR
ncbi:unnamed protein product [Ectocarpus fasciculatus]